MTDVIDIEAVLANQKFLEGRTRFSDTTGVFARMAEYRDGRRLRRRLLWRQPMGAASEW